MAGKKRTAEEMQAEIAAALAASGSAPQAPGAPRSDEEIKAEIDRALAATRGYNQEAWRDSGNGFKIRTVNLPNNAGQTDMREDAAVWVNDKTADYLPSKGTWAIYNPEQDVYVPVGNKPYEKKNVFGRAFNRGLRSAWEGFRSTAALGGGVGMALDGVEGSPFMPQTQETVVANEADRNAAVQRSAAAANAPPRSRSLSRSLAPPIAANPKKQIPFISNSSRFHPSNSSLGSSNVAPAAGPASKAAVPAAVSSRNSRRDRPSDWGPQ
jgi:hypothetical protein